MEVRSVGRHDGTFVVQIVVFPIGAHYTQDGDALGHFDAKFAAGLGSHVDRHDSLGKGILGKELFRRIMQDPRMDNIPLILETPDESIWAEEIQWLKEQI